MLKVNLSQQNLLKLLNLYQNRCLLCLLNLHKHLSRPAKPNNLPRLCRLRR